MTPLENNTEKLPGKQPRSQGFSLVCDHSIRWAQFPGVDVLVGPRSSPPPRLGAHGSKLRLLMHMIRTNLGTIFIFLGGHKAYYIMRQNKLYAFARLEECTISASRGEL